MNIGDKVRLLHHKQEGIVTRLLPDNLVEVEIEDGFKIPVLKSELSRIAKEEAIVFQSVRERNAEVKPLGKVSAETGFFAAFLPINDQQLSLYLVNNTDIDILFTLGESRELNYSGIAAGHLKARTFQKYHEASLTNFNKWSPLLIQCLFFKSGYTSLKEPLIRKLSFNAATFFKSKKEAPLMDKEAYLFQIDQAVVSVNPALIKDAMQEKKEEPSPIAPLEEPPRLKVPLQPRVRSKEIDLHIEVLSPNAVHLNAGQMLQLQIDAFEKELDQAIASAVDEVIFIHGTGNGTLRNEIQRRLGKHPHVAYFQDARKEKFGFGATIAKIK